MKDKVKGALKNVFPAEFLNRIDTTVVIQSLTQKAIRAIVDHILRQCAQRAHRAAHAARVERGVQGSAGGEGLRSQYEPALRRTSRTSSRTRGVGLLNGRIKPSDHRDRLEVRRADARTHGARGDIELESVSSDAALEDRMVLPVFFCVRRPFEEERAGGPGSSRRT